MRRLDRRKAKIFIGLVMPVVYAMVFGALLKSYGSLGLESVLERIEKIIYPEQSRTNPNKPEREQKEAYSG